MNFAVSTINTLSLKVQEQCEQVVQTIENQYSHMIDIIRVRKRKLELKSLMSKAKNYSQWKEYALEYDQLKNVKTWREKSTDLYDCKYIKHLTDSLRTLRICGQYNRVIHVIRSSCSRNTGNILNPELYSKSFLGTKRIIEEYQEEVIACLNYITKLPDKQLSKAKKLEFFAETRHAFGRTAVLFSGGGGLGIYHYGVIKTMVEKNLFPRVIAGSSAGSMFAAFIGVTKPEDLHKLVKPENVNVSALKDKPERFSLLRKIKRLFKEGHLLDRDVIIQFLRDNLGDLTFQQAYDRTGWMLNITVTGHGLNDGNHILNYLTAPNVLIWSAVMASCSIPYVFGAIQLYCKNENDEIVPYIEGGKKFVDGSLGADVPTQKISELFNVNFFVVSQVNPWVIPFMNHSEIYTHSKRKIFLRIWEYFKGFILMEVFHRVHQLRQMRVLPAEIMRYFNLITQNYTGNITIWPVPHFTELFRILTNPSYERLVKGALCGSRCSYPKINRIETALAIEKALEDNHQMIKRSFLKKQGDLREVLEEYEPNFGDYTAEEEPEYEIVIRHLQSLS